MFTFNPAGPAVPAGPGPASRRLCLWFALHLTIPPHPFYYHWYFFFFFLSSSFLCPPLLFLDLSLVPFRLPLLDLHGYPNLLQLLFHLFQHHGFFGFSCQPLLFVFGTSCLDFLANVGAGWHFWGVAVIWVVVVDKKIFHPNDVSRKILSTKSCDFYIGRVQPKGGDTVIYHFH